MGADTPLSGATHLLPRTAEERTATGDPRPSIDERYSSKEDFLAKVQGATTALASQRYLLEEDVPHVVEQASKRYDLFRLAPRPALTVASRT